MGKILRNKYGQKLLDSAKKSTTDAIKTASKRAIQKTAEATGDLIDRITSVSKKKPAKEFHNNDQTKEDVEIATPKKRYISPEEKKKNWWIKVRTKKGCIFLKIIDELMSVLKKIHISRRKTTNYLWIKGCNII